MASLRKQESKDLLDFRPSGAGPVTGLRGNDHLCGLYFTFDTNLVLNTFLFMSATDSGNLVCDFSGFHLMSDEEARSDLHSSFPLG